MPPDDSDNASLASIDEQFYTEAYPSKLCAFCNLSEKSFLGQVCTLYNVQCPGFHLLILF